MTFSIVTNKNSWKTKQNSNNNDKISPGALSTQLVMGQDKVHRPPPPPLLPPTIMWENTSENKTSYLRPSIYWVKEIVLCFSQTQATGAVSAIDM